MSTSPYAGPIDPSSISERATPAQRYVRVAVVQLDYHPAFKDTLYDPLFCFERETSSLLPDGVQAAPLPIQPEFQELRRRVRAAYSEQICRRAAAIVTACQGWGVQILVFPEYALPSEVLQALAREAGEMIVVAGSHYVDRETISRRVYESLGGDRHAELLEHSVTPILHAGRLLALVPKLHAAKPELGTMKPGAEWEPVPLPKGFPGPMGVLICLDFLSRQSEQHLEFVARPLKECRFLSAPALTKTRTLDEFKAQALKEARREHRPVLFANYAPHGGSTIVTDEGRDTDLRFFPEHAGRLEPDEEGVVIADIDLGCTSVGSSTPYVSTLPIIPIAAASLVYRGMEHAYVRWLDALQEKLDDSSKIDFDKLEDIAAFIREEPPPIPARDSARKRRLERLVQDIQDESSLERVRKLTAELILPEDILPVSVLRSALARGAADEVQRWVNELDAGDFGPVAVRLREPWEKFRAEMGSWAQKMRLLANDVIIAVRGGPAPHDIKMLIRLLEVYEEEVERGFKEENDQASQLFDQGRYQAAREIYRAMQQRAEDMIARAEAVDRPRLKQWALRCRLNAAFSSLNLQEPDEARNVLFSIDPGDLSTRNSIQLAEALALIGERDRAEAILPAESEIAHPDRMKFTETRQTLELLSGRIPGELVDTSTIRLRAAALLLTNHDLAAAAERAMEAIERSEGNALTRAIALQMLTSALRGTLYEFPSDATGIPVGRHREDLIAVLDAHFAALRDTDLPVSVRHGLGQVEAMFRALTHDTDWLEQSSRLVDSSNEPLNGHETSHNLAFRLVREGGIEVALRALPPDDHPWRGRYDRVTLLAHGSQIDRALNEALVLVRDFPGRAPIEYVTAELLASTGRVEEAVTHAELAFQQLPGLGYRLLLAKQRFASGNAEGAWDLLKDLEGDNRPRVLRARALVAEATGRLDQTEKEWRRYLALKPEDGPARVRFARLLFHLHRPEEAAAIAWKVFLDQGDRLDMEMLHTCGSLQRLAGPLDAEQTRRIKDIATRLKQRFATDAKAEHLRLNLLVMLGALPEDTEPIDFAKLAETGYLYRGEGTSALTEYLNQWRTRVDTVAQLARHGAIPVTTACKLSNTPLALLATRILERTHDAAGVLCPPVSLIDELPAFRLEATSLLMSDVEFVLLEVLELLPRIHEALGAEGRLILFQDVSNRIIADAIQLRMDARPDQREQTETLLRSLERIHAIEPDPTAPFDDAQAARRADAAIIDDEEHAGVIRISPRAFVRTLHEQRIIDDEQRQRIESRLSPEPEPLPAPPEPLPERIVASWFFVEELFRAKALDAVFHAYRGQLHLGPAVVPHFRRERDDLAIRVQASELADRVHARLIEGQTEGWIRVELAPTVSGLPPLREPDKDGYHKLILDPLREMLGYRHAVLADPAWWRLTAEFFGSAGLGDTDFVRQLAWRDPDEYVAFIRPFRKAASRDLTLPALVRHLLPDRAADPYLVKLAGLGFPDALGAAEVLRLERQYRGLHTGEPKRILGRLEWMAHEPGHLGGEWARLRLAQTYARTIFEASFTTDRTHAEHNALIDGLLRRLEDIGEKALTNTLDQTFAYLAARTADRWQTAWRIEGDTATFDPDESPIASLWKFLSAWSGTDGSRRAAHGRAMREVWRTLGRLPGGPPTVQAAALALAHWINPEDVEDLSLLEPEVETAGILSALWQESPFSQYDELLAYGAKLLADEPQSVQDAREARFRVLLGDDLKPVRVRIPIEALFLRLSGADKRNVAPYLKRAQGRYDGICYQHLTAIELSPDDAKLLASYAEHTAAALFRLVQDDPPFIRMWGQSRRFGLTAEQSRFDELLEILSEPKESLSTDKPFRLMLAARVTDEAGCWFNRTDKAALFAMASEIPGILPAGTVLGRFADKTYFEHVREALDRLDHSNEHPIARIAGDVIFLRVAAARRPSVKLPEGEIDLRDILPARFGRLLETVMGPPAADTLGSNEAALLRVCSEVIQRLAWPQVVSIHDGLWLTYRLFQWLCLQLEAIAPDARRDGMRRLVAQAPKLGAPLDLLDPAGFGRDLFDHRLATVLHALGAMEELVDVLPVDDPDRPLPAPRTVSSPELEDKLLALAKRAHIGTNMRSVLDWHAPGNVPDLALSALLRLNGARFADMTAEARTRRFEALPADLQALEKNDQDAFHFTTRVVLAAADAARSLTAGERTLLEAKLRAMADGPTSRLWRWFVFVAFFADGADHLEDEAFRLTSEHLGHTSAPVVLGRLLLGVAARDPARVELMVDAVLDQAGDPRIDAVALIAGSLGRVWVHGKPGAQNVARHLLLRLAERPLFRDDPRMTEVIGFFGLRELGA